MAGIRKMAALLTAMGLLASASAQATLYDRGGGLLYDDVLKITWLQDANYAMTSGYDADGLLSWTAAKAWAANLVYHDTVRNVDWTDWRLPSVAPVNGHTFNDNLSYNGSTDFGYNITSPASEMSYMYYVNLGLKGLWSASGTYQPDWGMFGNGSYGAWSGTGPDGWADVGLVDNLRSFVYWSGTTYPASSAFSFYAYGLQRASFQYLDLAAWAVRPGDVAVADAVPEPMSLALLGAGLGGLALVRRRRTFAAS